ncbi:MAG: hypothetical protein ACOZF0_02300 [Thermodesulfobacteriota bacterium]
MMSPTGTFSLATHGRTLMQLVTAPGVFFENSRDRLVSTAPLVFLAFSAVLFTVLTLVFQPGTRSPLVAAILMGNAFGMVLILSFISYLVMVLSMGKRTGYRQMIGVFAYASGAGMMIAWIPHMLILSEPWRWFLVGMGLAKGLGLKWTGSLWIIFCAVTVMTILFRSVLPLLHA